MLVYFINLHVIFVTVSVQSVRYNKSDDGHDADISRSGSESEGKKSGQFRLHFRKGGVLVQFISLVCF